MQLNPYLVFNGQCEAAFKFYEERLGGKILVMLTHGSSPMAEQGPPEWRNKIMHARLTGGRRGIDGLRQSTRALEEMKGFYVALNIEAPADAERIFHALAENGTVRMPLQETFWAARFGMLIDQFGVPWMINCE